MRIEGEIDMIHKNGNLFDDPVKIPLLPPKSLYAKDLIINNNSSKTFNNNLPFTKNSVIDVERSSANNDDNNNNGYIQRKEFIYVKCPVCHLDEFSSHESLETHIKSEHTGFKPSCRDCGEMFASLKSLATHSVVHVREKYAIRNSHLNSKIFNYLENKNAFYQKLTDTVRVSQSYKCNFCSEHFTGVQLMVHWKQCKHFKPDELYDDKIADESNESDSTKSNFLAGLNLHSAVDQRTYSDSGESNRSSRTADSTDASKTANLMESIQNVGTSAVIAAAAASSSFSTQPIFVADDEKRVMEEEEDPFKLEVRDMKRRGEFPCRICKKIFRNLRALKGHARIHISGNRGIRPYECNICSFSTNDKSIIIRHIRNHNGDHPYKCQLCFSTFTTKANCERHLRNAHRKTSRDDIKKLLVDLNSKSTQNNVPNFKTKLQSLLTESAVKEEKVECKINPTSRDSYRKNIMCENGEQDVTTVSGSRSRVHEDSVNSNDSNNNTNSTIAEDPEFSKLNVEYPLNNLLESEIKYSNFGAAAAAVAAAAAGLIDRRMSRAERQFYEANYKTYNDIITSTGRVPIIHRGDSLKTSTPYPGHFLQSDEASDTDEPLDLSVDVLDLSKKKKDVENDDLLVEDLSAKSRERERLASSVSPSSSSPFTPPLKGQPRPLFLKNEICYNFPTPIPSFFTPGSEPAMAAFSRPEVPSEGELEMVNTTREMLALPSTAKIPPLTFGQLVANAAECYEEIHHNIPALATVEYGNKIDHEEYDGKAEKAVAHVAKFKDAIPSKSSRAKLSAVKMVMKDGVLVEKQKQRRYRTEKPFSCAHCIGRFTLRSNMDRHVKQQHPGFWRQRQRGGSSRSQQRRSKNEISEVVVDGFSNEVSRTSPNEFAVLAETSTHHKCHDDADSQMDVVVGENIMEFEKCKKEEVNEEMLNDDEAAGEGDEDDDEKEDLVIDEESPDRADDKNEMSRRANATFEKEEKPDLASVRSLLDNVSTQTFSHYFRNEEDPNQKHEDGSEEDEEGLVAGSSSEGNGSGGEEKSITDICTKDIEKNESGIKKKRSAYSSAPNRVHCDFCYRSFPWASSLRRHTLTHTGQKPYKCSNCPLLFTTKSNCDRHFLRKHRNQSQEPQTTAVVNVSALAEGIDRSTTSISPSSSARLISNFSTRNVPERPFKCSQCPSSTFSTFQNLKKHIIEKHNQREVNNEESTLEELHDQAQQNAKNDEYSAVSAEPVETVYHEDKYDGRDPKCQYDQSLGAGHVPSDLPFKCHLCDRGFVERQEALDHMSENHSVEFQHLICKGALDMSVKLEDTVINEDGMFVGDENNVELVKGRFPDYSSRKVICAFCLRRFWSAEDLRRHMRTHTGERPFACDICQRRFTLKHSMLRHRKKHWNKSFTSTSGENSPNSDDEDTSPPCHENRELRVLPYVADRKSESCSNVNSVGEYKLVRDAEKDDSSNGVFDVKKDTSKMCNKLAVKEDGVDLIAKLLDIEDKELVDEMITSKSADDVAKLLGVQK